MVNVLHYRTRLVEANTSVKYDIKLNKDENSKAQWVIINYLVMKACATLYIIL